ncbi:MAG TPA: sortase, partial [Candidatus Saccharimonadaceae bacterium]|nr:sortase [Candidatus Saccharimonadaceae bacterium]
NPVKGGNFIIAAHRFSIEPTPGGTIVHSPFYHIDALQKGDQILIDYDGQRYGYEVSQKETVPPDATQIEAPSNTPKLTLYSCDLTGSAAGRYVIIAKPLGEVTVSS